MMEVQMLDGADLADRTPPARRSVMIATLTIWAALAVLVGALIGGLPLIGAIVVGVALVAAVLAVRIAEVAFGLVSLVAGGVWTLFWGVLTLHYGLGVGTEEYRGEAIEVGVHFWGLAILGTFTSLGLVPLSLGVSFVFGAGPLAKPATDPDEPNEGPSRRGRLAMGVEAFLVVAILVLALIVVRTEFSGPYPECCSSVSNAPG